MKSNCCDFKQQQSTWISNYENVYFQPLRCDAFARFARCFWGMATKRFVIEKARASPGSFHWRLCSFGKWRHKHREFDLKILPLADQQEKISNVMQSMACDARTSDRSFEKRDPRFLTFEKSLKWMLQVISVIRKLCFTYTGMAMCWLRYQSPRLESGLFATRRLAPNQKQDQLETYWRVQSGIGRHVCWAVPEAEPTEPAGEQSAPDPFDE